MPRNSANNGKEAERSREKMKDKTKDKNIKEATEQPMEVQEPASSTFASNNKTIDADRKSSRPTDELKLLQVNHFNSLSIFIFIYN
uniref:Uncharacterized protein n=1 Tax=Heterorhabditis bacteriophora TaxID=37862 RepID=A0A1I7X383_HETBA